MPVSSNLEVSVRAIKLMVVVVVAALLAGACGDDSGSDSPAEGTTGLSVYTSDSLEEVTNALTAAFEEENPDEGVEVVVNEQAAMTGAITSALADVAIVPDLWLDTLSDDLEAGSAGQALAVIAVPAGDPDGITLEDFAADADATTAICGETTGVGNFSVLVLQNAGVTPDLESVSEGCEQDSLQQIADGELDAALMFRANLDVPDGVELLDIDEDVNVIFDISYVVPGDSDAAKAFGDFMESDTAQTILEDHGYL
jgi:ABC-type molybdate transport system substrate-binding protein